MPDINTAAPLLVFAPLLLVAAGLLVATMLPMHREPARLAVAGGVGLVLLGYLHWRLGSTIPWGASGPALAFALACLAVELFAIFDAIILYAALARRTNRSAEADAHEARLRTRPEAEWPAVDMLIATYNEPLDVLEKTILGARALDWPSLNVWVADDGRRPWLRDYCAAKGVGYITRPDNAHAKAGNINHALGVTSAPYVAVLDADFVPQTGFLTRTMGFFEDPGIGIVQIPHAFYNHDPLQSNLALRDALPDDQRFFFEAIMPGRDGWDAAFCCGSNSITRRTAFEAAGGGLPTGSITEDMLLTLALLRQGFITRYLNEPLAFGLAPESLAAFFVQRARWAQGAMQILFLKEGPLGPNLRLRHRIFFLPTAWASQCLMLITSLIAPLVFLFLDVPPLVNVTAEAAIFHLVPMVLATVGGIVVLGGGRYYPLAAQVLGTFQSFRLLPVIVQTLIKPHGHAFKVTPKGADAAGGGYERGLLATFAAIALATFAGLIINALPDWRIVAQGALVPMVAFWCGLNIITLFLAAMLCLQMPALRAEERFASDEQVVLRRRGSDLVHTGRAIDISVSGIALRADGVAAGEAVLVNLAGVGSLPGTVMRVGRGETPMVGIAFAPDDSPERDRLITRLFTRRQNSELLRVPLWQASKALFSRIWSAEMALKPQAAAAVPAALPPPPEKLPAMTRVIPPQRRPSARNTQEKLMA